MSILLFNPDIFNIEQNIIIEKIIKELSNPTYQSYNIEFINNLFLIISGYEGYYASSIAHELITKYIFWIETHEQDFIKKIKNNFNFYFTTILNKFNINIELNLNNNLVISSKELKNKLNLIRNELKLFDINNKSPFDIKKYINGMVLNKNNYNNLNRNNITISTVSFDPFDDELETVFLD